MMERPFDWPRLSIAPDQGSDVACAYNYLAWGPLGLNDDRTDDSSHGAYNGLKKAVKQAGLWPHVLCMMTAYAVPLTPYGEGRRAVAARDAITDFQRCSSSSTDPLFIEMLPNFLRDTNCLHRLHEDGIADTILRAFPCTLFGSTKPRSAQ